MYLHVCSVRSGEHESRVAGTGTLTIGMRLKKRPEAQETLMAVRVGGGGGGSVTSDLCVRTVPDPAPLNSSTCEDRRELVEDYAVAWITDNIRGVDDVAAPDSLGATPRIFNNARSLT